MDLTSWPSGKPNYTPQLWCLEPGTCFPTPGLKREDWRRQGSYIGLVPSCQPCPISVSILAWFHPGSLRPLDPFLRPRRGAGREGWGGCPRRGAGREGWGGGVPQEDQVVGLLLAGTSPGWGVSLHPINLFQGARPHHGTPILLIFSLPILLLEV